MLRDTMNSHGGSIRVPVKGSIASAGIACLSMFVFAASSTASEETENMSQHNHTGYSEPTYKDVEEHAKRFDDPSRDEWQRPEQVLDFIDLKLNDKFADLGAGTGYFSTRAALRVKNGIVYAIDSQPEMLEYIQKRAAAAGLSNIKTHRIDHDPGDLPETVDVILIVNTYHHIFNRISYFNNLKRWLNPDGKLVVVEGKPGTPMEPPLEIRVTKEMIGDELAKAGYAQSAEAFFLPYQYLQVFRLKK